MAVICHAVGNKRSLSFHSEALTEKKHCRLVFLPSSQFVAAVEKYLWDVISVCPVVHGREKNQSVTVKQAQ